jgi:adenylate kinase
LVGISVEAFQYNPLDDLALTTFPEIIDNKGYFRIMPQRDIDETNSNVYLIITNDSKKFISVRDKHGRHKRKEFFSVDGT